MCAVLLVPWLIKALFDAAADGVNNFEVYASVLLFSTSREVWSSAINFISGWLLSAVRRSRRLNVAFLPFIF